MDYCGFFTPVSSCEPCKSFSGSVHDLDSEYSIQYVQTSSTMSLNIPLTTPISSSMKFSGLSINVGNLMAQTSSTWTIPNISVTPIPPNSTNTQMHVSEGPGTKLGITSRANKQSEFPYDFLLNPGQNLM
ncbi:hypothetical protein O181_015500 [Austropuccinia psidii MF-1]|uniref:Uncharacterized protein n=1 Tax=Austropuccinia psidii MF-1 TaxID=1389203 RepID=A0A9Q3C423_9BASI|nr:hypothetical protein [Austropuccinia psidii MF-1]